MADRILTQRQLNRALLARQHLLEGELSLDPFRRLSAAERRSLDDEGQRLKAFHAD